DEDTGDDDKMVKIEISKFSEKSSAMLLGLLPLFVINIVFLVFMFDPDSAWDKKDLYLSFLSIFLLFIFRNCKAQKVGLRDLELVYYLLPFFFFSFVDLTPVGRDAFQSTLSIFYNRLLLSHFLFFDSPHGVVMLTPWIQASHHFGKFLFASLRQIMFQSPNARRVDSVLNYFMFLQKLDIYILIQEKGFSAYIKFKVLKNSVIKCARYIISPNIKKVSKEFCKYR
ncbi:hypothetical protein ACJX0J_024108, partial [Zea mays]